MIDGLDGLTAAWHYAGILGLWPTRMSLRRLWMMAEGKARQSRIEIVELAQMVWGISEINLVDYVVYGEISESGVGKAMSLTDQQMADVQRKAAEMLKNNPSAPKLKGL